MATANTRQTRFIPAEIEAQICTDTVLVQIIRLDWREDAELLIEPLDHFQIDLCLSARLQGMSICYPDHWGPMRFERVGELLMIPPGERVRARCDFPEGAGHSPHASTVVKFDPSLVYRWSDAARHQAADQLTAMLDIDDQNIYALMGRLSREAQAVLRSPPSAASLELVDLIARQLGIEVGRFLEGQHTAEFRGGLAAWRLRLIDARAQQVGDAPTIAELAQLCNISTRQLQRGFRVSRGCTVGRHIEQCRIANARRLLQGGESISRVAITLGYASQSSFSQSFRRVTGMTPASFCQRV